MNREIIERWRQNTPEIQEALEELEKLGANQELRWEIEAHIEGLREYITGMQHSFAEGLEEGIEKGREEGREEGLEKGRERTLRELLVRLASQRFGALPQSTTEQLEQLSPLKMEQLVEGLLSFESLEQFLEALAS